MKGKIADRRVQRTKKALSEALIQLILTKGYEKVTIQDITENANVGRSTFYIHYESKEQLLMDGPTNLNVKLFDGISSQGKMDLRPFFEHILENKGLAKSMLSRRRGTVMNDFFRNNLAEKIKQRYSPMYSRTKVEQKRLILLSDASAAAVISVLISWLEDEFSYTPQEMSDLSLNMVTGIFRDR